MGALSPLPPVFPPARALPFLLHFDFTISDVWSLNLFLLACVDVGVYWAAIDFRIGRQIVSFIIYYRKRAKLVNIPRIFYTVGYSAQPLCATTSHKRPPPITNHLSKTPEFSQSKPYSWNRSKRPPPVSDRDHVLGLTVNDFPLFLTFVLVSDHLTPSLISIFVVCTMLLRIYEEL